MTMVCSVTPEIRTASPASMLAATAKAMAGHLAAKLNRLAQAVAEHRRHRLEQAALEALPFDLRKDLGWPAGDTRR